MSSSHIKCVAASRPTVAAVKEEQGNLARALREARERLPGLLPLTLPAQVVIKPNLCDITSWETGVTTDAEWLPVLAAELRSIRSDVTIRVVESDAISAYKTYRSCDETFERLGFVSAATAAEIELINLSTCRNIEIPIEGVPFPVRMPELFLQEMYFISIANLKVHAYTRMTGILKNSMGLMCDPDIAAFHPYLSALIGGLNLLCPPDLCIIDGRVGLEGQGPILGFPVRMDTILFGNDALAMDETACQLMGIPPKKVPHVRHTASALGRSLGDFGITGELRPRVFAFKSMETHRNIQVKWAAKRLYRRMDAFTSRWIDRSLRIRKEPAAFARSAIRKLIRSRRAQSA